MSGPPAEFKISETQTGTSLRITVAGELDLATAPLLEDRLSLLRTSRSPVRLDLSEVDFIDSTGLHALVRLVQEARRTRWQLDIEPDVSPNVMGLLKLTHLEEILSGGHGCLAKPE